MRIEHDIKPVTYMKTKAAELLRSVDQSRRPGVITQSGCCLSRRILTPLSE